MPNIQPIDVARASGATAQALQGVKAKLGIVPNMIATMAHSPAALQLYFKSSEGLAAGSFSTRQRESIALAVAEANGCDYCLSAHTALGGMAGLKPAEILAARGAQASNARDHALVSLARSIVVSRGNVSAAELAAARTNGLSDADILETVAVVVANIFTNYVNHIAGTEIDFPRVEARKAA